MFYVRASRASVAWALRYLSWAHSWPLGAEQNIFDATLGHTNRREPFAPASVPPPDRPTGCPAVLYRLMDVNTEFLLSAGGGETFTPEPWWSGEQLNATSIHFLSVHWKGVAAELFGNWSLSRDRGRAAEARLPSIIAPYNGKPPTSKPFCYYGRLDHSILTSVHGGMDYL
mmetsp:Transcript_17070/g.55144  ORF Transcript_17070/g.55144 Transcript_17070/m.55144 type:complete len:171 (+) Transcript_17070:126-638(+)